MDYKQKRRREDDDLLIFFVYISLLGLVTPLHAVSFASVCSIAGIGMLYFGANGLAAALGAVNLVLYTSVYTPMKRLTILNTWLGAVGEHQPRRLYTLI